MEFLIFNSVFLKPKHKIYILSKNVLMRTERDYGDSDSQKHCQYTLPHPPGKAGQKRDSPRRRDNALHRRRLRHCSEKPQGQTGY